MIQILYKRMLILMILLTVNWNLWSGFYEPLSLFVGIISCMLCLLTVKRMKYFEGKLFFWKFNFRLIGYWIWLMSQIIQSSLRVVLIILNPKLPISPCLIKFKTDFNSTEDQLILCNSITLTPGTLSLDVSQNVINVHALTENDANKLIFGDMNRRIKHIREV